MTRKGYLRLSRRHSQQEILVRRREPIQLRRRKSLIAHVRHTFALDPNATWTVESNLHRKTAIKFHETWDSHMILKCELMRQMRWVEHLAFNVSARHNIMLMLFDPTMTISV